MTAVLERLMEGTMPVAFPHANTAIAPTPSTSSAESTDQAELTELQSILAAHARALDAQTRMLETLDARREQLDELIVDTMPIVNAILLMITHTLGRLGTADVETRVKVAFDDLAAVRRSPAPSTLQLLRRLRNPDVRRGIALSVAALGALGRATAETPTQADDVIAKRES